MEHRKLHGTCERKWTVKGVQRRCGLPTRTQNRYTGKWLCEKHMPKEREICSARSTTPSKSGGLMPCIAPAKYHEGGQWYCARHAPSQKEKVDARQAEINRARDAKSGATWYPGVCQRKWAPVMAKALQRIADGHNDARRYAAAVVQRYTEEMTRARAGLSGWAVYQNPEDDLDT